MSVTIVGLKRWIVATSIMSSLVVSAITMVVAFSSDSPEFCNSQPVGNPNVCHVYTWLFPNATYTVPRLGLFNNDTSYYFPFNATNDFEFSICVNTVAQSFFGGFPGPHNDTLTLQYLNASLSWVNAGPVGGGFGIESNPPNSFCQGAPTSFVPGLTSNCGNTVGGGVCIFRIAGSCYEVVFQSACPSAQFPGWDVISFTELSVIFFSGASTIQGTITCTAPTRSLVSFTTQCVRTFSTGASQPVTVGWYATNSTGVGAACGLLDNCKRGPATFTCTLSAVTNTCNIVTTYSPAFTGSVPIPNIDWSPLVGLAKSQAPPNTYNLLT